MPDTLLKEFVFLWTIVDPIGAVPVFIAVVAGFDAATQRKIAIRTTIISAVVLLFFIAAGRLLLQAPPWKMSRTPPRIKWACRPVGADTASVLTRYLGLPPAELRALAARGVI